MLRVSLLIVLAWLLLAGGCARMPGTGVTQLKSKTLGELQGDLLGRKTEGELQRGVLVPKADLDHFRLRGPFAVSVQENAEIRLSTTETINTDLYLSAHADMAPLLIFLHGYDSSKDDHSFQAMHLASWGMHCLVIQLPNQGPWVANGRTMAKLVNFISRWPEIIDNRFDLRRIILVGHSFGGSSVSVALALGAPAIGGILLDPAAISKEMPQFLGRIKAPVMVLGADERVFPARNRDYFYRYIRSGVTEISIRDATHEDAQYPSRYAASTEDLQITFVSALTSAAFSLSSTGGFDYAWRSFGEVLENGKFFNAKKK